MNRIFDLTKILVVVCLFSASLSAQESDSKNWEKAKEEMKAALGTVPIMFEKLPEYMRASTWEWFKSMNNPDAEIPPKYSELISLAVAAQIPCDYCVYAHIEMAKMKGATEQEINEAVMRAADVRHWSTILNGNDVDYQEFKSEWDVVLDYMETNTASK